VIKLLTVFCVHTFSSRTSATSATSAGFVRSSPLSCSRPGQAVRRPAREGGMDRPSQHKSHQAGSFSSSQPGGLCWVIFLAFDLIGCDTQRRRRHPYHALKLLNVIFLIPVTNALSKFKTLYNLNNSCTFYRIHFLPISVIGKN
jgi:hypothetical protein